MSHNWKRGGALVLLACLAALLLVPAWAHAISEPRPRISFELAGMCQVGSTITVTAWTQNADSVSWRLLRDGRGQEVDLTDSGGSILLSTPGSYTLRGFARNGYRVAAQTVSFTVLRDSAPVESQFNLHVNRESYFLSDRIQVSVSASNVLSVSWSLSVDGKPTSLPGFGIYGGTIDPERVGSYVVSAQATCSDGSVLSDEISFLVTDPGELFLNLPLQVAAGSPFPVTVTSESAGLDKVSVQLLNPLGLPVDRFDGTEGILTCPVPGLYQVSASEPGSAVGRGHVLASETVETEPLAGASSWPNDRSIFSWESNYIDPEVGDTLDLILTVLDCDTIYQYIHDSMSDQEILGFLQRCDEYGCQVFYLCGDSSWAAEPDAASMLRELERVVSINTQAETLGIQPFAGILYDVEWLSQRETFVQCVENYKVVYAAAQEYGIHVNACLPYNMDTLYGYSDLLEDLIANGCHSVSIMNYYKRGTEAENIRYEVELCAKYGKPLINITETLPVGSHDLTDDQTYHNDGLHAVEELWRELDAEYSGSIRFSYHCLASVRELLGIQ